MRINENIALGAMCCGAVTTLLGGWDTILKAMLLLMGLDLCTGFIACLFFGKSKYSEGGVSSEVMIKGSVRKISMLCVVMVGVVVDKVMGFNYVRNAVVMYFIATEGISILEHLAEIGVPLPDFLTKVLEVIKDDSNGGNGNG